MEDHTEEREADGSTSWGRPMLLKAEYRPIGEYKSGELQSCPEGTCLWFRNSTGFSENPISLQTIGWRAVGSRMRQRSWEAQRHRGTIARTLEELESFVNHSSAATKPKPAPACTSAGNRNAALSVLVHVLGAHAQL